MQPKLAGGGGGRGAEDEGHGSAQNPLAMPKRPSAFSQLRFVGLGTGRVCTGSSNLRAVASTDRTCQ